MVQTERVTPVVLTIAGFDPSSGAGVTADIKTAAAHDCFALSCITALTVQSTRGVRRVEPVRPETVRDTLEELAVDLPINAVRIGMLGAAEVAEAIADFLERLRCPVVVLDPIIRASSGAALLEPEGFDILRNRLLPLSTVITPNVNEAAQLTGVAVEGDAGQLQAAQRLLEMGAKAAVVTGGHLDEAADLLLWEEGTGVREQWFRAAKLQSRSTHGTGCAFATALACNLALGKAVPAAVSDAKEFVRQAISSAEPLGTGIGPMKLI